MDKDEFVWFLQERKQDVEVHNSRIPTLTVWAVWDRHSTTVEAICAHHPPSPLLRSSLAPTARHDASYQYDGRIVKVAAHAMPMMLVCHCMFAIYVFSAGTFFESDYVADVLSSSVDVRYDGGEKRTEYVEREKNKRL